MAGGASTLRDALLPAVDIIRGIPGALGLRLFTVVVFTRAWSGSRVGIGTNTDTQTGVKIDLGIYQTKVRQLTEKDVVASGGLYSMQDYEVGPITPPYTGSAADNDAISVFDPPTTSNPQEIYFQIQGPGLAGATNYFKKKAQNVSKNFRYTFIVERTSEIP